MTERQTDTHVTPYVAYKGNLRPNLEHRRNINDSNLEATRTQIHFGLKDDFQAQAIRCDPVVI